MLKAKMLSIDFISWSWKVEKKTFLSKRKIFFSRDADSIRRIACSNRDKRKDFYLIWLASVNVFVTSPHVRNVTLHQEIVQRNSSRPLLVCCRFARHDDKFVTRLSSATRIVWLTELDDNSTAFFSLSNSSSYMRRNSSREIWAESEAINQDVKRLRFADV
jgi:hypothetical protein